jgi:hypothetical protein
MKSFKQIREAKSSSGYDLYHKTFSGAMQHAYAFAKKKGFEVDKNDIDNKVATGPKKPSSGKTNKYILKTNKKNRHAHIQVANLDNKRYELNMYMESVTQENVELEERFTPKEIKMAIGVASDKRYAGGNYSGAVRAIEKIKKGLSKHKQVAAVLKRQNESVEETVELDENRNLLKDYEQLKKKGKSDGQAQDILLSMPKYKRYDSAKLGKLIGDALRKGTIRKKAPFKLAEEFKPHKMYDPKTGKEYDAKTQADHERMAKMGYTHEKPEVNEKALHNVKGKDGKTYSLELDQSGRKVMVRTKNNFGDIATIPLKKAVKIFEDSEELSEMAVSRKDFDKIKKGDVISFVFDSSMKKGHKVKLQVKSKTRSAKYNVDKVNMVDANDSRNKTKFTLFSRGGKDATLGWGDMAVVIKSYKIGVNEDLTENYRQLAQKGMGTETQKDARVGLELDYYDSKGNKQFGKIVKKTASGYIVKDDKTGKSHSFSYHDRMKAKKLLSAQRQCEAVDPADIDIKATDDDRKAADKNIIVQLRRVADLPKGGQVEFKNGKKVNLKQHLAKAVLQKYAQIKRNDQKLKFANLASNSPQDMQKAMRLR